MKDVIVLFTPLHTGTHFVRMLLESSPDVDTAIGEDFRIDSQFRPEYVLTGRGAGWDDAPRDPARDPSSERMLIEYFRRFLKGEIDAAGFRDALAYWQTITSETKRPLANEPFHFSRVREEFQSLGIELAPKQSRYLLYRGHCHAEHEQCDLHRLTDTFRVIATLRHPLRSILSLMRRNPSDKFASSIDDYLAALGCILRLDGALLFCTDLWQGRAQEMASVFAFLDLPIAPESRQYLALEPRVNQTIAKGDPHGVHNYCLEHAHPPETASALRAARAALDEGTVPPLLAPYWRRIRENGLMPFLERLGY